MKKTTKLSVYLLFLIATILLLVTGCKKDKDDITVTDIDGNVYNTVTIGTQVWIKSNLKVTKLNDGSNIQLVENNQTWTGLKTPGYCWYSNNEAQYKNIFGAFYNFYTVKTGKLCPAGWHVPTDNDWTALTDYLGGLNIAGGKLKETGTSHWSSSNTGATNETGFTALPGGYRNYDGTFQGTGSVGYWWSSTESGATSAFHRQMDYNGSQVFVSWGGMEGGYSVRCVKD